jgi:hypothetical protein
MEIKINKVGIGVDIDETLSWTIGHWAAEMQKLFGNPENLTINELVDKYQYTQNVPYWQTKEALSWMEEMRNSNEFQKDLPLIEGANFFLKEINKIVPIAAYITIRPEKVREGTEHWLKRHGFPDAPVICRPNEIPSKEGNKWKAKTIKEMPKNIVGFIDDSPEIAKLLSEDYDGLILHFNKKIIPHSKIINCQTWKDIHEKIKESGQNKS